MNTTCIRSAAPHARLRLSLLALALALATPLAFGAEATKPLTLATDQAAAQIKVSYADQPLLVYAFGSNQFKPYVKALYTLAGDNVLLDSPPDHLHHHGLMYAITVNGTNFWEEAVNPGYERAVEPPNAAVSVRPDGTPFAVIAQTLYWVPKAEAGNPRPQTVALLIEDRTLSVSVAPAREEVAVQWNSSFRVGPAAPQVTLTGSDYHGLGVRFPRSWDRVARHRNAANAAYPTQGKHDLVEARWSAVANTLNGRPQTLAVFAHPDNAGPSMFFSMLDPFAYLSATQGLDKTPLKYSAGERFQVKYLVTVTSADANSEALARRYQQWIAEK